jgi:hypothetical protein
MTGKLPLEIIKDDYPPILPLHPDDVEGAMRGEGAVPSTEENVKEGEERAGSPQPKLPRRHLKRIC